MRKKGTKLKETGTKKCVVFGIPYPDAPCREYLPTFPFDNWDDPSSTSGQIIICHLDFPEIN